MSNIQSKKEYGNHEYPNQDGTSDCKFGCGCWAGRTSSGGPTGIDPLGTCPQNPVDGHLIGGREDYNYVVTERIRNLEFRVYEAEERLKQVSPSHTELADELAAVKKELAEKRTILADLRHLIGDISA